MIKFSLFLAAFSLNFSLFAQFAAGDKLIGGSTSGSFSQNPNYWGGQRLREFSFTLSPTLHIWKNARWSNGFSLNFGLNGNEYYQNNSINSTWAKSTNNNYQLGAGYQLRRWYNPLFEGKLLFYNHLGADIYYALDKSTERNSFQQNRTETTPHVGLNLGLGAGALIKLGDKWGLEVQLQPFSFQNSFNLSSKSLSQNMGLDFSTAGWRAGFYYQLGQNGKKSNK